MLSRINRGDIPNCYCWWLINRSCLTVQEIRAMVTTISKEHHPRNRGCAILYRIRTLLLPSSSTTGRKELWTRNGRRRRHMRPAQDPTKIKASSGTHLLLPESVEKLGGCEEHHLLEVRETELAVNLGPRLDTVDLSFHTVSYRFAVSCKCSLTCRYKPCPTFCYCCTRYHTAPEHVNTVVRFFTFCTRITTAQVRGFP